MIKYFILFNLFISSFAFARTISFHEEKCISFRVDFWEQVYTEIDIDEAIIHDPQTLKIYEVINWPEGKKQRKALTNLITNKYSKLGLTIRIQQGISSRFEAGMIRYNSSLGKSIHEEFKKQNLPKELVLLPHVESSYNPKALSKVKANGLWQIMPKTAKNYGLRDTKKLKEPNIATKIAAKIFSSDYQAIGSWPLSITGYNQGRGAMLNAKKQLGTDICKIIDKYDGKYFKFSGENFYASFLAVIRIVEKRNIPLYNQY